MILPAGNFTDVYTATVIGEDGTFVQVQATVTNIGPGGPNGTCRLLVVFPDGTSWKASDYYGRDDWRTEEAPGPSLIIGPCRFACTGDSTSVAITLKKSKADIAIGAAAKVVRVPSIGVVISPPTPGDVSGKFYEYEILIPWGHSRTALLIPGREPCTILGRATVEHSRSAATATEVSGGLLIFRGIINGKAVGAGFRWAPGNEAAGGWIWKEGDTAPVPVTGLLARPETDTIDGKPVTLTRYTAPGASWSILSGARMFRYSFIDDLGPILGNAAKLLVGNPATFFYKAELSWINDGVCACGVAEYFKVR